MKTFRSIIFYLKHFGVFALYCAVKARVSNSHGLIQINRIGLKYAFWLRIPSSDPSIYKSVFLKQEYKLPDDISPKVIIDAGANIGLTSIFFANTYPEAKIIALEPEKDNFKMLKKNLAPYKKVILEQVALWNKNEEICLMDPGIGNWGFRTERNDSKENQQGNTLHKVIAKTVDKIMQDHNLERISILKIDIEGAEKEVFDDTSLWIDKVDILIIELHDRFKPGCSRSFYNGTNGFDKEWQRSESVFLSRSV